MLKDRCKVGREGVETARRWGLRGTSFERVGGVYGDGCSR